MNLNKLKHHISRINRSPKCILCDKESFDSLPYYYYFGDRRIDIVQCVSCGLNTLYPMLSTEEVRSLYSPEYFDKDYHCGFFEGRYVNEIENLRREIRPILSKIRTLQPGGRYLELGCAGGAMLAEARDQGYDTLGVELSSEMAAWGRSHLKLDIRSGTLTEQQFPPESFNVVFLGDVIEHLLHPKEELSEIRRLLKPNGIVALAYPMELNHIVPRVRQLLSIDKESPNKPYHLFYYSNCTIRQLLERCGFEVELQHEDKIVRTQPLATWVVDSLNHVVTTVSGRLGDRGFTIGRKSK